MKDTKLWSAEREIRADELSLLDHSSAVTNGASAKTGGSPRRQAEARPRLLKTCSFNSLEATQCKG